MKRCCSLHTQRPDNNKTEETKLTKLVMVSLFCQVTRDRIRQNDLYYWILGKFLAFKFCQILKQVISGSRGVLIPRDI